MPLALGGRWPMDGARLYSCTAVAVKMSAVAKRLVGNRCDDGNQHRHHRDRFVQLFE